MSTPSLSRVSGHVLNTVARQRGFPTIEILYRWNSIVPPPFRNLTAPVRITYPQNRRQTQGTLVLACSPAAALMVQHENALLLSSLNAFLGFEAVVRVLILQQAIHPHHYQAPACSREPKAHTPPDVTTALHRLQKAITGRGSSR